jgi:hypothetical protein
MFHTIIIAGNVGRDPEMRYTPSGQPVTSFSMATNRQYTSSSGESPMNQYVKKGSKVSPSRDVMTLIFPSRQRDLDSRSTG